MPLFPTMLMFVSSRNILRVVFLCLHVLSLSSPTEIAVIGVLSSVTSRPNCEKITPTSVYEIESMKWLIDILNAENYTQGVKLEIDVADVCQSKSSVIQTIKLINKYKTGPKKLIGILSMTTSAKMLNVSWFLSSLPADVNVIQIGTTETAAQLNDRSNYRNFFRVIPDDEYQFQLIATLLKDLKWNYIAILHEKDVYGEEGAKLLSGRLPALGITLAVKLAIDDLNEQLFILTSDHPMVQGVVIIAQPWTLQSISKRRMSRFRFILTESVIVNYSFLNLELFENSFTVIRPQTRFPLLEKHWEDLFNVSHIKQNGSFRKMIQQYSECSDVLNLNCSLTDVAHKVSKMIHMNPVMQLTGLYIFAFLMRKQKVHCSESSCPISILKLKDIQNQMINFSYLSKIIHHPPLNFTGQFNEKGNLVYPSDFTAYKVYKNIRNHVTDQFSFQEVGQYNGNELKLNIAALKDSEMWGTCPKDKNCRTRGFPQFIHREGDIMLFGIVPVRYGVDPLTCPCYDELSSLGVPGSQLAEAMLYAVEQLNQRNIYKNLFPGKKIGIVIMDSCNQQIPTFKNILSFWRGTADICKKIDCQAIKAKTLVFIGGLTSEVSVRVSHLMTAWNTIQISYASSSTIFRDPLSGEYFKSFIRLTPADDLQIKAMIDICLKMKWLYISFIYADNAYGRLAQKEFLSHATDSKVCLIQSLPFKKGYEPSSILKELKRKPDAKIVIVFINSADLETLMTSLTEHLEEREFTFLGSEAWGNSLRISKKIVGSLSLGIDMPPDSAFNKYLEHKYLSSAQSNEWSLAAMESQCYMPLSLNKHSSRPCPPNITLKYLGQQHLWAPMVIQAVYAAAVGLHMSIDQLCRTVEVCPNLFHKRSDVIEIFKKVKLKQSNGEEKRVFDSNGDGTLSYNIYKIQQTGKAFHYIKIGKWSNSHGLILDTTQIDVPPLNCPNEKRCSECPVVEDIQTPPVNHIPAAVVFVFLVIILAVVIFICIRLFRNTTTDDNVDGLSNFAMEDIDPTYVECNSYINDNRLVSRLNSDTSTIDVNMHGLFNLAPDEDRETIFESFNPHNENNGFESSLNSDKTTDGNEKHPDEDNNFSYETAVNRLTGNNGSESCSNLGCSRHRHDEYHINAVEHEEGHSSRAAIPVNSVTEETYPKLFVSDDDSCPYPKREISNHGNEQNINNLDKNGFNIPTFIADYAESIEDNTSDGHPTLSAANSATGETYLKQYVSDYDTYTSFADI